MQQTFDVLFVLTLFGPASALIVSLLLVAVLPAHQHARRAAAHPAHA
jgi:hypothetical protein